MEKLSEYGVREMYLSEQQCVNGGLDGNEFYMDPELQAKLSKKAWSAIKTAAIDAYDYGRGFLQGLFGL